MNIPAFLAAVQGRSAEGARAALAPNFQGKANGKPLDRDAQVRLLESFWLGFPAGDFTMEPTGGSGRHVITWTFKGEHGGVYLGVPPTGQAVEFSGYIIAVSDKTGITSLDWKWDPKPFTKAILGPDDVGSLEVKDNFRADPSRRWSQGDGRHGGGQRKGKGKGQQGQPGQRQPGQRQPGQRQPRPAGAPGQGAPEGSQPAGEAGADPVAEAGAAGEGQAGASPGQPGQPRPPGQGRRRRGKGKGPRPEGSPDQSQMPQMSQVPDAPAPNAPASESSATSETRGDAQAAEPKPEEPKPDGT